jgi:hypothetical protein
MDDEVEEEEAGSRTASKGVPYRHLLGNAPADLTSSPCITIESPGTPPKPSAEDKSSVSSNSPSEEDIERAKQLRKNAFKKGDRTSYLFHRESNTLLDRLLVELDLAAIARTSAGASTSPN